MESQIKPTEQEKLFLNLAYSRFFDLYDEISSDNFMTNSANYRFSRIKDVFLVYSELINYEPLKYVLGLIKIKRPPMEAEIAKEYLKFIRNVIVHFPFFDEWDNVWVQKDLINWNSEGKSIDSFLKKYSGHEEVKYRIWQPDKKLMIYVDINFPTVYADEKNFLKDLLTEDKGILFVINLMRNILKTQLEE